MTYVKINVTKPSKIAPGAGGDKKDKITIVDLDDILTHASRDAKGVLITDKHAFKPNAYAIELYVTPSSIAAKQNSEGEADEEAFLQEVAVSHPGSELEIMEFSPNWLGRNVLIFIERCSDGSIKEYGAPCAPLRMKVESTDDKDVNKSIFTFASSNKGPCIAKYDNTLTLSDVAATVDADATTVDLASGEGEYQLTDNTAAKELTTCTNAVDGMLFTLLGSGGSFPASITDANDFVLKNGTSWSAIASASITFKAFKDGAASWKFFEQSRS